MNISKAKIAYYLLTFQKSKIPEYLLNTGNNWVVNGLADGTKDKVRYGLETGKKILSYLNKYSWLCPSKWRLAYEKTVQAFEDVVEACEDLKIEVDEVKKVTASFKVAYAEWCAD